MTSISEQLPSRGAPGRDDRIVRLAGRIGAEIRGIDVTVSINSETLKFLVDALAEFKVIFIRGQQLDYDTHVAFARRFGPLSPGHPIFAAPDRKPHLRAFDSRTGIRANHWHSDLTFLPDPPTVAFLRSVATPETGGDTMWASGTAAWASMPPQLQEFAATLEIVHSNDCDYIDATMGEANADYVSTRYEAIHPAVARHPATDEPYLLLGGFARRVRGYGPDASRAILQLLRHYIELPENTVRWSWRPGDLAIWDNLATQHYALYDYGDSHRLNERVTLAGSKPIPLHSTENGLTSAEN